MEIQKVFDYVATTCEKYGIDDSHGLKHSMGAVKWAERLSAEYSDIGVDEYLVILYATALHDLCDSKYRALDAMDIHVWLLGLGLSMELASIIVSIITSMSYSKLKALQTGSTLTFPDHGKWQRAYHIVRHADLLEAYKVVRCYLYTNHRCPGLTEDAAWLETRRVFDERVFKYVSDGWIFLESALKWVPELEKEALRCFEERDLTYLL
jgi:hypothetical protein